MSTCVQCGQTLPPLSKLTKASVSAAEATEKGWPAEAESQEGVVIVRMCLQCQIDRSEREKSRR